MEVPTFADRESLSRALDRWALGRRAGRPSAEKVRALADAVGGWPGSRGFDFHVVGSFPELGRKARDVDLVVRARPGCWCSIPDIEDVLIAIEYFGLKQLDLSVDTTFRELSEAEMAARVVDGKPFPSLKLYAARWEKLARSRPDAVRPVGRYLVEIRRSIHETSYFRKLPVVARTGWWRRQRAYREAVPLSAFETVVGRPPRGYS